MSWPLSHDFNEAIQNPQVVFSDPDLKTGETVVGATGLPLPRSGNFADVYQVRGTDGRDWAVKCFTRPVAGLADRYARISEALANASLPFTVGFTFLAEGILVGGEWRPVVKMEWVEGLLLNQVVRDNAGKPAVLSALGQMWVRLCKRMREAGVAHADVQHGNVLLVPGSRAGAYGLKLIDYDGMWVPLLANTPSGESGHPSFQHPARAATRGYSPDVDRFSHLVVCTALRGLSVGGVALWERYDNGDNLLFTEGDYRAPAKSKLMKELWQTEDPSVQSLVGRLAIACQKPIPQTPWLDLFAPEGAPMPLDNETYREAAAALGVALPVPVAPPPPPVSEVLEVVQVAASPAPPVVLPVVETVAGSGGENEFDVEPVEISRTLKKKRKKEQEEPEEAEEKPKSKLPLLLAAGGGGLLLLIGAIVAVVLFAGGKKQNETVQKNEEPPPVIPGPKPHPKEKDKDKVDSIGPKKEDPVINPPKKNPDQMEVRLAWSTPLPDKFAYSQLPEVSADSRTAVIYNASTARYVSLDIASGKILLADYQPPPGTIRAFPLKDGRFAFLTNSARAIPLIDLRTGESETLDTVPAAGGVSQFVSPDLKYVAVGPRIPSEQQPLIIRPVGEKGSIRAKWAGRNIFFTADSSRILLSEDNGRSVWIKLPSGQGDGGWRLNPSQVATKGRYLFTGSSDGSVLLYEGVLSGHDEGLHLIDGRSGKVVRSFPGAYLDPGSASLSADGSLLVAPKQEGNQINSADVINTSTGAILGEIVPPKGSVFLHTTILPDGSGAIAFVFPSKLMRYDFVAPGSPPKDPPKKDPPKVSPPTGPVVFKERWKEPVDTDGTSATIHVSGDTILFGSPRTSLSAIELRSGTRRPPFHQIDLTGGDVFCPMDNDRVARYEPDDTEMWTWDVKTGKRGEKFLIPSLSIPSGAGDAKQKVAWVSPNGRYLAVALHAPGQKVHPEVPFRIYTADKAAKPIVETTWTGGTVHFTTDSTRMLVAEYNGRFRWFTLAEKADPQEWKYPPRPDKRLHIVTSITSGGHVIGYTGTAMDQTEAAPCLVDGKTGDILHRFGKGYVEHSRVALSEDGRFAAVLKELSGTNATIEVVSVPKGTVIGSATIPTKGAVPTFALSADALIVHDSKAGMLWRFDLP